MSLLLVAVPDGVQLVFCYSVGRVESISMAWQSHNGLLLEQEVDSMMF